MRNDVADFNNDGNLDLLAAGNFYGSDYTFWKIERTTYHNYFLPQRHIRKHKMLL